MHPGPCPACASVSLARCLTPRPCVSVSVGSVHPRAPVGQSESVLLGCGVWVPVSVSVCQVYVWPPRVWAVPTVLLLPWPGLAPPPRLQGNPPRGGRGRGARLQAPTCPRPRAGPWRHAGAGRGSEREAGRGGAAAEPAGPGESPGGLRRGTEPHASGAPGRRRRHQPVSKPS